MLCSMLPGLPAVTDVDSTICSPFFNVGVEVPLVSSLPFLDLLTAVGYCYSLLHSLAVMSSMKAATLLQYQRNCLLFNLVAQQPLAARTYIFQKNPV